MSYHVSKDDVSELTSTLEALHTVSKDSGNVKRIVVDGIVKALKIAKYIDIKARMGNELAEEFKRYGDLR